MAKLLETCRVSPPPGDATKLSVPLSFFDISHVHSHPLRRLLFYDYPCSKPYFLETIVPKLKQSLSLTLKHYLPLAGKLTCPLHNELEKPVFHYVAGDSVSLTIAESVHDFDELVANHARDADQFYHLVPEIIPPVDDESKYYQTIPVIALRVTLFQDHGICIGLANHHTIGDASSIFRFMRAWASITKQSAEADYCSSPIFDRSFIKDPLGIDSIFWKVQREIPFKSSSFPLPTNSVRATFILHQANIKRLKDMVLAKKPSLVQVSSFVVTISYVWTCLVKSLDIINAAGEKVVVGDVLEEFIKFAADLRARARMDPPVPANYFGNCLGSGMAKIEHKQLVGEEGFVIAAVAIAEDIKNRVNNKDLVLKGIENYMSDTAKSKSGEMIRRFLVTGSPKFDMYAVDFGWGMAKKVEIVSIDGSKYCMSLCKFRDSENGLEIGLSLPKETMLTFGAIFDEGLTT